MENKITHDPYQRLKIILTENDPCSLTEKGSNNLNDFLGIDPPPKKKNPFEKIFKFFSKIDSFIFAKPSKIQKENKLYLIFNNN